MAFAITAALVAAIVALLAIGMAGKFDPPADDDRILVDREGVAYLPERPVKLQGRAPNHTKNPTL